MLVALEHLVEADGDAIRRARRHADEGTPLQPFQRRLGGLEARRGAEMVAVERHRSPRDMRATISGLATRSPSFCT